VLLEPNPYTSQSKRSSNHCKLLLVKRIAFISTCTLNEIENETHITLQQVKKMQLQHVASCSRFADLGFAHPTIPTVVVWRTRQWQKTVIGGKQ
jgi:hypothetical protein